MHGYEFFHGGAGKHFNFFQLPEDLVFNDCFKELSTDEAGTKIITMKSFAVVDGAFSGSITDVTIAKDTTYAIYVADYEGGDFTTETFELATPEVAKFTFPTDPVTIKFAEVTWDESGLAAQENFVLELEGFEPGKTTVAQLRKLYSSVVLEGIKYVNDSGDVGAENIDVSIYCMTGEGWSWHSVGDTMAGEGTLTFDTTKDIADAKDSDVVQAFGYQVNISGSKVKNIADYKVGDAIVVNGAEAVDNTVGDVLPYAVIFFALSGACAFFVVKRRRVTE